MDGIPMVTETSSPKASEPSPVSPQASKDSVRILIDLHISNGLHIQQKNLSYQSEARAVDAGYFLASGFKPQ